MKSEGYLEAESILERLAKDPDARRRLNIFCFGTDSEFFDEFYSELTPDELLELFKENPEFAYSIADEMEQEVEESGYELTDEQMEQLDKVVYRKLKEKIQMLEQRP